MEPSSNHNGNSDTVVEGLTDVARVCRNELGLVMGDSEKVADGASSDALVSSVANRSSDSEVTIRDELLDSKTENVTIEPRFTEGSDVVVDDVRVSGNETRSDALVSSVLNRSSEKEVKGRGELLESKSGTVMAEACAVQDLVGDVRVSGNETSSDAVVSSVLLNSSDVDGSNGVKIGDEFVESKSGTVAMEAYSDHDGNDDVRDSVGDIGGSKDDDNSEKSFKELNSDAVDSSFTANNGVKIGADLVKSKSVGVVTERSSDSDKNNDNAVHDSVGDSRGFKDELGSMVDNSEKVMDKTSLDAVVSPVALGKIGTELVESKNGTPTMEQSSDHDGGGGTVQGSVDDATVSRNEIGAVMENVGASSGVKIGDELVESKSGVVAMETSSEHGGKNNTVVPDIVGDTRDFKDELGSVIDNSAKVMDKTSSDAVVSSVLLGNSDISASNGVKIGAELVESKTGTPTMKQSSDHDGGGGTVQGSVDDATVSRNEIGAVMENVEKVVDESSSDALASSVRTSNGVKIGADLLDSETPSSDHDRGGVSGDKSGIAKDENEVNFEEKEGEYKVTDLVWAKVKNYPWWPGQIFDPSAATDKAKKHSNKRAFLVAYFGDQSFAWNKAPNIKHFRKNFSKMAKQSNSKAFHHAVNCALDEAYRRAEFGLVCSCLSEEVVSKFKSQVFVNAGITEEASRIDGGDRFSTVANFKPVNAVMSLHDLAREDIDGVSRLEALSVKAQLLAYLRWKGYNQFSTQHLEGLDNKLEDDSEVKLMEDDKMVEDVKPASVSAKISFEKIMEDDKMVEDVKPASVSEKVSSKKRKLNARDSGSRKLQDDDDDDSVPIKKEKRSKNVTPKGSLSLLKKENKSEKNSGKKEKSSTNVTPTESPSALKKEKKSEKKSGTKIVEDKGVKEESRNGTADQKATTSSPKKLFRIGDTICKIAKQLSESPTVQNESQKSEKRKKSKNDTA